MQPVQTEAMKLFRLPNGLQVWNSPEARLDTNFIYSEHFGQHCYERNGVTAGDGYVIFDVGAHIGLFGLSLMSRFRNLRIYCFEPVPATYACLERNLAESQFRAGHQVTALNVGLGAADAQTRIEFFPGTPCNSTLYLDEKRREFSGLLDRMSWADIRRINKPGALLLLPVFPFRKRLFGPALQRPIERGVSLPCEVRTLSGIIREHQVERIDLLKIDVEGAEMDVLAGIEDCHWPLIRQLCLEVHPARKSDLPALRDRLRSIGFTRITFESGLERATDFADAVGNLYAVR